MLFAFIISALILEILLHLHLPKMNRQYRYEGIFGRILFYLVAISIALIVILLISKFNSLDLDVDYVKGTLLSFVGAIGCLMIPLALNFTLYDRYYNSLISTDLEYRFKTHIVSLAVMPKWLFMILHPVAALMSMNRVPVFKFFENHSTNYRLRWDQYRLISKSTLMKEILSGKTVELISDEIHIPDIFSKCGYTIGNKSIYVNIIS